MMFFAALTLSLLLTMAIIPLSMRLALRFRAVDLPNERKVHARPMPKTGGVAMAVGVLIPVALLSPPSSLLWPLMAAAGLVVVFGFVDDLRDLGFKAKFAAQLGAALLVALPGGLQIRSLGTLLPEHVLLPGIVAVPLTVLAIVGVTNAVNLADGLDGLAGGISLLSFGCIGFLAWQADRPDLALIAAAVCGAIFGFLRFNTHPAMVFMGDAGSQLLGFLAVTLALAVTRETAISPLFPLLLLGFPVFDTVRVMLERVSRGLPPFVADRSHFHHKLLDLGFLHPEAVVIIYGIQAGLTAAAFLLRFHSDGLLLGAYLVFCAALALFLRRAGRCGRPWREDRFGLLVRDSVRRLRGSHLLVRLAFPGLQVCLFLILLLAGLQLPALPHWVGPAVLGLAAAVSAASVVFPAWRGTALRLAVYLVSPFLIHFSDARGAQLAFGLPFQPANLLYILLAAAIFLLLRYRRSAFRSTPLDFLILLIAIVVPAWVETGAARIAAIVLAVKIVTFFFGFELFMVERQARRQRRRETDGRDPAADGRAESRLLNGCGRSQAVPRGLTR